MWDQWDTLTNLNLGKQHLPVITFFSFSHRGTDFLVRSFTSVVVADNNCSDGCKGKTWFYWFLVKKVRSVSFQFWLVTKRLKWKSHIWGKVWPLQTSQGGLWCNRLKILQMISQYFQNGCLGTFGTDRVGTLGTPTLHSGQPILIYKAAELTAKAFARSFTIEKITSSFRATSPLYRDMITRDMFFHSVATDILQQPGKILIDASSVEFALHPQHETSCDWNINKGRPQTQVQKTTWKVVSNITEQQRQRRSIRKSMLKVASPNGLNSRSTKLEQCNNQRHLFYNDIVLCIYLNYCIFILHMYCKSHPGRE